MSRSVTVSGWNSPRSENAFTVTSGPSTTSSTSATPLRDSSIARAIASGSSSSERTSVRPFCPCRSGALTTDGMGSPSSGSETSCQRGCGTPAFARSSRCFCFETARLATAPLIGCGKPHLLGHARRDPDRPVDAGRDHAFDRLGGREALDALLVLGGDDRPPIRELEPRRRRVAVERDHEQPPLAGRREQAELRGPGP